MNIPKYITEMSLDELLEELDGYGDGWYYIHEAAKRIRKLRTQVYHPTNQFSGQKVPRCNECHLPNPHHLEGCSRR